ncbi:MAG: ABC transporter permease subunit [Verrucomicrobiales bacterium]|nr:ABC transporter permease subunit [Verrucomicrobiales bacterium]
MTFLPIVERELRVASRRAGTHWMRSGAAFAAIAIGAIVYVTSGQQAAAGIGTMIFWSLTTVAGLFCLIAGARSTSDSLSEEKRDGTLGLLFLTDLRGYDVVAGKFVAGSMHSLYALMATLPTLALPLLMGGVTAGEFWRVALVLLNTMFFSLSAGMIASAVTTHERHSAGLCTGIVLFFAAVLPLIGGILGAYYNWSQPPYALILPSPGAAYFYAFAANYPSHEAAFAVSLLITHVCGWLFLISAGFIVRNSWQDKPPASSGWRFGARWVQWSLGNSVQRARHRTRLLEVNAFYWLAARSRIKPALVWATIALAGSGWILGWVKYDGYWLEPTTYIITAFLLNSILKGWLVSETCLQLAEDRRTGALELLLSTPLEVADVIEGQFQALRRQFLGPVVFAIVLALCFLGAGLRHPDMMGERGLWWVTWIASLLVLLTDLWAVFHVGLWQSLTTANANRANSATMMRILWTPWIIWGAVLFLIATLTERAHYGEAIFLWLFISLAVSLAFGFAARRKLLSEFRQAATLRYLPRAPLWNRLFG